MIRKFVLLHFRVRSQSLENSKKRLLRWIRRRFLLLLDWKSTEVVLQRTPLLQLHAKPWAFSKNSHLNLNLVVVVVWWSVGLELEGRSGENRGPAIHSSHNWLRTLLFGDSLQGEPWYPMVGIWSRYRWIVRKSSRPTDLHVAVTPYQRNTIHKVNPFIISKSCSSIILYLRGKLADPCTRSWADFGNTSSCSIVFDIFTPHDVNS